VDQAVTAIGARDRAVSPEARFRLLFARHYPSVFGYAARRLGRDEAGDAAAEVFTVAWRRLDRVPDEPGTLPYLYAVARKVVANQERSAHRRARLHRRLEGPTPLSAQPDPQRLDVVAAMMRLRAPDREILRLAAWEDLDPAAIARALGCSANAASVRLHRAKKRLSAELERSGWDR
jgi:RNA polymerase sigma factor (sigma-70 family)